MAALLSDVSKQEVLKKLADSTLLVGSMVGGAFDVEDALATAQLRVEMLANGVADALSNESA